MSEGKGLADRVLDLVFFAPLGLALAAKDQIPKLASEGRNRFGSQAQMAKVVGRMAVSQGSSRGRAGVDRLLGRDQPPASEAAPRAAQPVAGRPTWPERNARPAWPERNARPTTVRDLDADEMQSAPLERRPREPAGAPGADADLPIPGYDSLSASQVVQRLPGLSVEELEAVRAYELAGRARKTVLLRIVQLRAAS